MEQVGDDQYTARLVYVKGGIVVVVVVVFSH